MTRPIPGVSVEDQPESVILRMVLYGESRGESALGKLAVLWVIHNRALKADTTLKVQVLKPWQFSSFNENDPNRAKLLTAWKDDPHAWKDCDAVAQIFEARMTKDPTDGATHYYVVDMDNPPKWGRGHPGWHETALLGRHVFGNAA